MTKTSNLQPLHRGSVQSVQPWLRDQYQTLRAEATPRWEQARATVVPALADASHRVREEFVPAAAQFSSRVADEAVNRSAPLRAELSDRAVAALAGARGQVTAAQIEHLKRARGHRKFWLLSGAAAAGAALGTAAVLWQRSRDQAWVEDEAVDTALDAAEAQARQAEATDRGFPPGAKDESGTGASSTSANHRGDH